MKITLGMIVLNEEDYIGKNLQQHYSLVDKIIIVEGADQLYPKDQVSLNGLSIDCTEEIIRDFPDPDKKIKYIQHGWTNRGGDQAKCELRNRYAELTDPGILCVLDADEFYTHNHFAIILERARTHSGENYWRYPFYHFWHNTDQFITGGYFDIGHTRFWRWSKGYLYNQNHNWPEFKQKFICSKKGFILQRTIVEGEKGCTIQGPVSHHFGFVKSSQAVRAKTDYYINRGEAHTRPKTISSRESWFKTSLDSDLSIHRFGGELPECFIPEGNIVNG